MKKIAIIIALLITVLIGYGCKRIYDAAQVQNAVIEQTEEKQNVESEVKVSSNKTVSGVFINKKEIDSWLQSLNSQESIFGQTDVQKPLKAPKNNSVLVCSGYGCKFRQSYRFTPDLFNQVKSVLDKSTDSASERENLIEALALVKKEVGLSTNTSNDSPGEPFMGNGRKDQMSNLDETANTTQYLYVLADNGYIRFHHINRPETGSLYLGTVSSITDAETKKHFNITYDKKGLPVIIAR